MRATPLVPPGATHVGYSATATRLRGRTAAAAQDSAAAIADRTAILAGSRAGGRRAAAAAAAYAGDSATAARLGRRTPAAHQDLAAAIAYLPAILARSRAGSLVCDARKNTAHVAPSLFELSRGSPADGNPRLRAGPTRSSAFRPSLWAHPGALPSRSSGSPLRSWQLAERRGSLLPPLVTGARRVSPTDARTEGIY
jgi:hypothetical protein